MGIPFYFRKITTQIHGVVQPAPPAEGIHRLFLDFNGVVHNAAAKVGKTTGASTTVASFERDVLRATIAATEAIVAFAKPSALVYLGVDGVAPMAKIAQQRRRRHLSHFLKRQDGYDAPKYEWDSNAISPGTAFMRKLRDGLHAHFVSASKSSSGPRFVLSADDEVGEGEHKIVRYIDHHPTPDGCFDAVHGLDADLIMLSMLARKRDIVLMREPQHFRGAKSDNAHPYLFLQVDPLRRAVENRYGVDIPSYVFACVLAGNDFLPAASFCNIKRNDIDLIMMFVAKLDTPLVSPDDAGRWSVSHSALEDLLGALAAEEDTRFEQAHREYFTASTKNLRQKQDRTEFYGICNKNPRYEDLMRDGCWRRGYYVRLFGMSASGDDMVNEVCTEYLNGLRWVCDYYYNRSADSAWFYPYNYSPTLVDLHNMLQTLDDIDADLELPPPMHVDPELQLLMILPVQSVSLLPKHLRWLMRDNSPISYMYPVDFRLETYLKTRLHECIPRIPVVQPSDVAQHYWNSTS